MERTGLGQSLETARSLTDVGNGAHDARSDTDHIGHEVVEAVGVCDSRGKDLIGAETSSHNSGLEAVATFCVTDLVDLFNHIGDILSSVLNIEVPEIFLAKRVRVRVGDVLTTSAADPDVVAGDKKILGGSVLGDPFEARSVASLVEEHWLLGVLVSDIVAVGITDKAHHPDAVVA